MGVRGNNNIKIVGTKAAKQFVDDTPTVIIPTIFNSPLPVVGLNELKRADLSIINNELVDHKETITDYQIGIFNQVWDKVKEFYQPEFSSFQEFLNDIYATCKYYLGGNILSLEQWPLHNHKNLADAMVNMGILKEKGKIYTTTELADDFVKVYGHLNKNIPFDWNNFVQTDYKRNQLFLIEANSGNINRIRLNNGEYILESSYIDSTNPLNVRLQSVKLYRNMDNFDESNFPIKEVYSPRQLAKAYPDKGEVMVGLFNGTVNANVEMIPIASSNHWATFQGTINNEPIFIQLGIQEIKHCRNLYGNDLRMVLDYNPLRNDSYNNVVFLAHIIKDNQVVYSAPVREVAGPDRTSEETNQIFNTLANNLNRLRSNKK